MKKVIVHRRHTNHPWIFSNEVIRVEDGVVPGAVVRVEERRKTVGSGFYNPHSLIAVRLFSADKQDFDAALIKERMRKANDIRNGLGDTYRLVFSESDGLPGLVVDKYDKYFVVQINALGMELNKDKIFKVLVDDFSASGIYEKNDEEGLRSLEGLEPRAAVVHGTIPEQVEIEQDGVKFLVDLVNGQKTGFFLDQRLNRQRVRDLAHGEVLDCFCYTGAFSLYAGQKVDVKVTGVDSSEPAIRLAQENARLNKVEVQFSCQDVFDVLNAYARENRAFDTIILDPPSFTKSRKKKFAALRGYKQINLKAMQVLREGGLLFTSSCSYHISMEDFITMLQGAASDAKKAFRIIDHGRQAPDHPVPLNFPESEYLKALFLQMV
ncbi:MAG TPA: class I SAM-dependent rRNA methyltransferase [bacterium]